HRTAQPGLRKTETVAHKGYIRVDAEAIGVFTISCCRELSMNEPSDEIDHPNSTRPGLLLDPRRGDLEDDRAATSRRSLLSIAGSLLVEISPSKLLVACSLLILLPAFLLGLAPLLLSAWIGKIKSH